MISYKTTNPIVESRFKKITIRCPKCRKPFIKREGNSFWIMKRQGGEVSEIKFDISQDSPVGSNKITCSCGWGIIFAWTNETINIEEDIDRRK